MWFRFADSHIFRHHRSGDQRANHSLIQNISAKNGLVLDRSTATAVGQLRWDDFIVENGKDITSTWSLRRRTGDIRSSKSATFILKNVYMLVCNMVGIKSFDLPFEYLHIRDNLLNDLFNNKNCVIFVYVQLFK